MVDVTARYAVGPGQSGEAFVRIPSSLLSNWIMTPQIGPVGRARALALGAGMSFLLMSPGAVRADEHEHHHHHHEMPGAAAGVTRSEVMPSIPKVALRDQSGGVVTFAQLADEGRPVVLNFIYTSCTAICPPMTRVFAEVQERLGANRGRVRMISVSIDPEQDTPRRLKQYAGQFGAVDPWVFLTGTAQASASIQQAFNVFRPDKMGHTPVTFLRRAPGQPWVRLDGFAQPAQIIGELQVMLAGKS